MSAAYSCTVRSLEKRPIPATLRTDIRAQSGARRIPREGGPCLWRAADGFSTSYPPFIGGPEVGQWRPTPPAFGAMSAQGLAFTAMFVLRRDDQFRPGTPRGLDLNLAMADTAFTTWSGKRAYGADPAAVTWRPASA